MSKICIRKGKPQDADRLVEIFENAKRYMRSYGNNSQWSHGYPSRIDILKDIELGQNYVGTDHSGEIVLSFAFIIGEEPTYLKIENGNWTNNCPYGTIHRIASSGKFKGMLNEAVKFCFSKINNIRIDTHKDNSPMITALKKLDFIHCGTIYCRDGSPRLAFQKVIII